MTRVLNFALGSLLFFAVACATLSRDVRGADQAIADTVCEVWLPITYDGIFDTRVTVDQIKANNRARSAYCNGG